MKSTLIKILSVTFLATSLHTTGPTHAVEKSFPFENEWKPFAAGFAAATVVGLGTYLILGREKPAPAPKPYLTREQVDQTLQPLKQELSEVKGQNDKLLAILQAKEISASPLVQLLLREFHQAIPQAGTHGAAPSIVISAASPTRPRSDSKEEAAPPPSPMKRLSDIPTSVQLTKYQKAVKDNGKNNITERLWKLLGEDNPCAEAVSREIAAETDNEASFDVVIRNESLKMCKLKIIKNETFEEKIIRF